MKFMSFYKPGSEASGPPDSEHLAEMGTYIDASMKAGWLLSTEGLVGSAKGARVRVEAGKYTVTDGPFAEAKEIIGGYAILQVKSKEEAIEHCKEFLKVVGRGECEVRQIFDPPAPEGGQG